MSPLRELWITSLRFGPLEDLSGPLLQTKSEPCVKTKTDWCTVDKCLCTETHLCSFTPAQTDCLFYPSERRTTRSTEEKQAVRSTSVGWKMERGRSPVQGSSCPPGRRQRSNNSCSSVWPTATWGITWRGGVGLLFIAVATVVGKLVDLLVYLTGRSRVWRSSVHLSRSRTGTCLCAAGWPTGWNTARPRRRWRLQKGSPSEFSPGVCGGKDGAGVTLSRMLSELAPRPHLICKPPDHLHILW